MMKATNSALMRKKNEKIILSLINRAPVSRVSLAKKTGLTKAAVTVIVDDLKNRRLVTEQSVNLGTIGRNPVMLHLNYGAIYAVGINITRRDVTVGITDLGGNIIEQEVFSVSSPEEIFLKIKTSLDKFCLNEKTISSKIHKVSVVTPGPVDTNEGIILNPPNFKDWHGVPIVARLRELTGYDVVLENVSAATAIAEKYFGAAQKDENFITLQVDDGIGSGIVLSDALFKGPCELGHISIKYDGEKCECGNRGCLEKYASIPCILSKTSYNSWQEAIDCNDTRLIEQEAEYLSTAIISANNIFNFDKIVLCGELSYKSQKIIERISEKIKNNSFLNNPLDICAGKVQSKLLIAAAMAIHDFFVG